MMDDGLILNLTSNEHLTLKSNVGEKKGGRWTDRSLKTKRTLKRKTLAETTDKFNKLPNKNAVNTRPTKKPRLDGEDTPMEKIRPKHPIPTPSRPTQIISSLFSFNPKITAPVPQSIVKNSAPSNAPLDSSSFSGLGVDSLLVSHLTNKMGILKPTAIQRASLPVLLSSDPSKTSRDVFLQSQTGSGKTLSYLLPIIQDLLPLSTLSYIDRSIGTLAVIIAPTRELAKQISDVLETLLKMRLRPEDDSTSEPDTSTHLTRFLVSGLLIGGATRTHEKARLRKGLPILVSTPGRLLDHLQNTSSFNVGKCRWLVLDEADQLMELGFEETLKGILLGLDGRRRLAKQAVAEGKTIEVGDWGWERQRRTILCSATIRENVQKLAGTALTNPLMVKATEGDVDPSSGLQKSPPNASETFTPPSQLSQKYVTVPLKLRLVTLVALLRTLVSQTQVRRGSKIIVFHSCTDSVDFHWNLLSGSTMEDKEMQMSEIDSDDEEILQTGNNANEKQLQNQAVMATCPLLPEVSIFRLHGSLSTPARLEAVRRFVGTLGKVKPSKESHSSVLFCTSVASRGLDLPLVRAVIQYDLPTEGGVTEYVHRVGRTARAGKGGEAWSFVAPSEVDWVPWVEGKMRGEDEKKPVVISGVAIEDILRSGFGGRGTESEARATEVQLAFERWVLRRKDNTLLARTAFLSHMRAYATHPTIEKHIFHIRNLHMGHLAKAFALRDAPKSVKTDRNTKSPKSVIGKSKPHRSSNKIKTVDWDTEHNGDAEKRMQAVVRAQGRLSKKGGLMASTIASEFQISSGADLERLSR